MRRKRLGIVSAAAVVVLFLGSCGRDDDIGASGSGQYPKLVPRAVFVKTAKAICEGGNEDRGDGVNAFYERREKETGEFGVGAVEAIQVVIVPSLRRELDELEAIGLPKGETYAAETIWQTLRTVLHEVEAEGIYAWRSAKLLPPFRNRAKPFGLDGCVIN